MEHPLKWHEPSCPCSKDFIERSLKVHEHEESAGPRLGDEEKLADSQERSSPMSQRRVVKRGSTSSYD